MNTRQLYPIGKTISWPHPGDDSQTTVTVTAHVVDANYTDKVIGIKVQGADFIESAPVGRLEQDGSGLK